MRAWETIYQEKLRTPEQVAQCEGSYTGFFLKSILADERKAR